MRALFSGIHDLREVSCTDPVTIIVLSVIAVFSSITAPLLITYATTRLRRQERLEDYARQDAIAQRVAEVARTAADNSAATERKLNQISQQALQIREQANQIHILVNSDMTAARQAELDQTRAILAVLRRVTNLTVQQGAAPDPEDVQAIARAEHRVQELEQILADRLEQFRLSERQPREPDRTAEEGL